MASRERELLAQIVAVEQSDHPGLEIAQRHAELNRELEQVWAEIANIDDQCRAYVDLRRIPVIAPGEILELLQA